MKKNQNGITLIALVITIIVLLILAGVSIALLTSDGNILDNAGKARADTDVGTAKENAGIQAAGYLEDYYDDKYVNNTELDENNSTAKNYVINKFKDNTTGEGYTFNKTNNQIEINAKASNGSNVNGTITDEGAIKWSDSSAGK